MPSDIAGEFSRRQRTLLDNFCSDHVVLLLTLSNSCFASFAFLTEVLSRMLCLSSKSKPCHSTRDLRRDCASAQLRNNAGDVHEKTRNVEQNL
jgi:lantibiotic modifying enzyme